MTTPDEELRVHATADALADAAAEHVRACIHQAVRTRGRCLVALAGGSTPRALYERLASGPVLPWVQVEFCFGDERCVPPDHPDSNARMVREALLERAHVPSERVHRIRAELTPDEAARDYCATLSHLFGTRTAFPRFDLVLLGLGADGHTASLFPHSQALGERAAWVVENFVEKLGTHRITLTFPVLNAAAEVVFLVAGADKANALRAVREGGAQVSDVPARGVRPTPGRLVFYVDSAAASGLSQS